ncbi:unnamed protein product, partial [Polarella glacialis]
MALPDSAFIGAEIPLEGPAFDEFAEPSPSASEDEIDEGGGAENDPANEEPSSIRIAATKGGSPKRRAAPKGFVVNTAACTGKGSKDLFTIVANELAWRERDIETRPPRPPLQATIYCVMQTQDMLDRLPLLVRRHCWISRYLGLLDLCDKGNFARMALACEDLSEPNAWDFNPKTWVLPDQLAQVREALAKSKRTFIVKPEDGSQGDGIFLCQGVRDLDIKMSTKSNKAGVVQKYLDKPLLLDGIKFDLRLYVCLIGGSDIAPPLVYLCREGLARFCTEIYEEPSSKNMHKCMAHLTNYSLNKRSDKFEHSPESMEEVFDTGSGASKRPMTAVLRRLQDENPGFSMDAFYDTVAAIIRTTVAAMAPVLVGFSHAAAAAGTPLAAESSSFQVLGYDIMMDTSFKPYLLEINNSPSLCIDEALALEPDDPRLAEKGARPGRPQSSREKEGKVCLCMDMAQPHTHRPSVVDVAVKTTVVKGVFLLLEKLKKGDSEPEVEDYISVDVSREELWEKLQRVEAVFHQCGGAQKAFTGHGLRRTFGSLCGQGGLEKHDLDALSQRLRSTMFVNNDRGVKPDALRLFDFLSVIRQVGTRAFPGVDPRDIVEHVLDALGMCIWIRVENMPSQWIDRDRLLRDPEYLLGAVCYEFDKVDTYHRGLLTSQAFSKALDALGLRYGQPEVEEILQYCTITDDGYVHYKELLHLVNPGTPRAKQSTMKGTLYPSHDEETTPSEMERYSDCGVSARGDGFFAGKTEDIRKVFARWERGSISNQQFKSGLEGIGVPVTEELERQLTTYGPARSMPFS